jgi:hypothetical protein
MTGWNEDNFLERLLAQVRQQRGAERDPCPDAETLCAVLEGEAPAPLRELVTEHLRHCADCAELQNRLLNFDAGTSPEPEAVWKETRKRLDNWLEGFLRSEAANLRAAKPPVSSRRVPRWETLWRPLISWKVVWGLGVAALLVLIADGVLVMELRRGQPPRVQVATRATVPQKQPANVQRVAPPPLGALPSRGGESGVGRAPEVGKSHPQRRIEKALKAPQEHALPQVAEHPLVGAPLVGARGKRPHALPQVAERLPSKPQPPYEENAGAPGGQVAGPLPSSPPLNAAGAPATEHLPSVRLEPGAHLLIVLSSANRLPNGSFQFRGTLLLPVVHTGLVPLGRGAEVIGAGTISQGQTSLAVTEFVVQGARYTLKVGNGAMNAQTPGAGGAVQFDRYQVLEMWPASPSTYAKAPDASAPPEPQK